jgi:bifunctional non-homologous end joining protein LigD
MSLSLYKQKRNLESTPEPNGGKSEDNELRFVVQKHAASHLHYDFRLEMRNALKSWAVPKGPSMRTEDKRLAMMVEDHPYDYKDFEGIIPSGYGAGTVIVWDEGTYEPTEEIKGDKKAKEKFLLSGLHKGKIAITLKGKKLKGKFALIKAEDRGENSWLLMKLNDKFATESDISLKDKSVISGKTIEKVSKDTNSRQWNSNREEKKKPKQEKTISKIKTAVKPAIKKTAKELMEDFPPPGKLPPMLATLVDKPFDEAGWLFEVKWDGYRAIAYCNGDQVDVMSRNNKSFNDKFYPVHAALKAWNINAVVDGEIIVVNEKGISDFSDLQNWRSEDDGPLVYYVFDILWLDGKSLVSLPLIERKKILASIVPGNGMIKLSENFNATGTEFFSLAEQMNLEGIIAKKENSLYLPGTRSKDWLKIKTEKRQELVIGGYTVNENTSKKFSALLTGWYENGQLRFISPVGTGFSDKTQADLLQKFKPLKTKECPFAEIPEYNKPSRFRPNPPKAEVQWLQPFLVAEVSYREMTKDGALRHPSFKGLREDKNASEIVREKTIPAETVITPSNKNTKLFSAPGKKERKTLLNPTDETQTRKIGGHDLKFTNLSKIFWPDVKVTKRDMLNYYYQVAPFMLPYMKDRPQTLNRHPNGINQPAFYQKDVTGKIPSWIETFPYHSDADGRDKNFLVCSNEASLLYIASLGCIEMNPWSSRIQNPDHPDWCIIDLDPDKNTFDQVIEAALVTKKVLDEAGVDSFCKTSGSTGLHIYIPLGAKYSYEDSKEFGRAIVKIVHAEIPGFTSIERLTGNRNGKMYLDFLQNRPQATIATAYSLRPKPGATVSMPLNWEEVKKGLKMSDFTIFNSVARIKEQGDIFKGVLGKGISMDKALKKLSGLLK